MSCRSDLETYACSATPATATTAASATIASAVPTSADFQLRVIPMARTIVRASMHSTAEAKKTAVSMPNI